jgi:formimidoylglutamate deiminase
MSLAIIDAAAETGIGLTHLPVFYAHSGFGGAAPGEQRRFLHDVDGYAALLDRLRHALEALPDAVLGVAPHSLRAVTPERAGRRRGAR